MVGDKFVMVVIVYKACFKLKDNNEKVLYRYTFILNFFIFIHKISFKLVVFK